MKKINLLIVAVALIALATSCRRHGHRTIIATNDGHSKVRLEYSGRMILDSTGTVLENLSPGGYIKYEDNGGEIEVTGKPGGSLWYELPDGTKSSTITAEGKMMLLRAIKMIRQQQAHQYHPRSRQQWN